MLKPEKFFIASLITFLCAFAFSAAINIYAIPDRMVIMETDELELELAVGVSAFSGEPTHFGGDTRKDVTVALLGVPVRTFTVDILRDIELVPCGVAAGVRFQTEGVLVLGTGAVTQPDGTTERPSDGVLRTGDLLLEINGEVISDKWHLMDAVEASVPGEKVSLTVRRENETHHKAVMPAVNREDGKNRMGVWVRDGTQGIGTITYFDPETNVFGALGHGITDIDTQKLMPVKSGILMEAGVTGVRKGKKGGPGELFGEINAESIIGAVKHNHNLGVFGTLSDTSSLPEERMGVGLQNAVREGPAIMRATVNGREVRDFDIFIERVNRSGGDASKGMVIRVTDRDLIAATNGIVQGMSGSPIIQDGRLIGAVTHVFVQNPHRGYGIFIENMLGVWPS